MEAHVLEKLYCQILVPITKLKVLLFFTNGKYVVDFYFFISNKCQLDMLGIKPYTSCM